MINKSSGIYNAALFDTTLPGGTEGDEVFDEDQGFGLSPSTKLLSGRQSKFKVVYGVDSATDLVMDVRPGVDYEDAICTS